jgi:hypothetical protein
MAHQGMAIDVNTGHEVGHIAAHDLVDLALDQLRVRVCVAAGQAHLAELSFVDLILQVAGEEVHVWEGGDADGGEEGGEEGFGEEHFDDCGDGGCCAGVFGKLVEMKVNWMWLLMLLLVD